MTGLEPIWIGAAAKGLTDIVVKPVSEVLNRRLDEPLQQLLFNVFRQYIQNYTDRHGLLKVLGMPQPAKLEEIYTDVKFLGDQNRWQFDPNRLEEAYRQSQERRFQSKECKKQDGLKVANEQQYLMVLGQPGAGKSTFLRRIGLEALKGEAGDYQHKCVPIFLELKQFTTGEVDLEQAIAHEFATCGFPDSTQSTRKLLKNGKLLILLDGLDEVPTQQLDEAKVIDRIRDFVDRYKQNRFIASCRTAAYQGSFKKFSDVTVADFDDKQIKQFIDNWFRAEKDIQAGTAQHCWDLLKTPNHSATKELAQTPLLLTLLCLIFSDTQNFPEKRAELYRQALNILLREWGVKRDPIYKDLSLKLETSMLGEIAYQSFASNRLFFLQQEVVDQIHDYLASKLNASCLNSEDVLQAIQVQQGILVERTKNILSFSHLTLQEYLCAQHIAEQSEVDNSFVTQLLSKYFTNRRWREVWQLLTGLMGEGSETLLLQMEQQAQTYLTDPGLSSLIDWADQETRNSEGSYKPSAKRTIAVYLAIALSRFDDHYYALANDEYYDRAIDISYNSGYYLNCTLGRTFALALALGFDTSCIVNFDFMFAPFESNGFDFGLQSKFTQEFRADCTLDFARVLERTKIFKAVAFPDLIFQLESLQKSDLSSYRFPERDFDSPLQDLWDFALEVSRVWHRAFHLKSAWDSSSNIENLYNYVYANELIIRCKEAAVRVSSQTWAGIEARMLTLKSLPSQDQDPIALPLSQNSTAQPQFKSSLSQPENVTMNFYGTVYGTAGNVQGDQNVNPTE